MKRIEHQRVVGEQGVTQIERATVERIIAALRRDQAIGADAQQALGLVGIEGDAVIRARLAIGKRPGERGMEAELRRQRPVGRGISDRRGDRQCGPGELEGNAEGELEGIGAARLGTGRQAEYRALLVPLGDREHRMARKTVLGHRIVGAVEPDHAAVGHPDHRKQDRRVMRPERRIGVGHQLAALRIAQVRELGAERVDRGGQRVAGDLDERAHCPRATWKPANDWLTGINSSALMLRCGGSSATHRIVAAMSSPVIGSAPA